MSWPAALGGESTPQIEQVLLRIAYHLHQRTLDPNVAAQVLREARITRKTLSRYACATPCAPRASGDLHATGPRRLDLYAAICRALGEDPGKVLWAASLGGDYPSMLALLNAEVQWRPKLLIAESAGCADIEVVPVAGRAGG